MADESQTERFAPDALRAFAAGVLRAAGLPAEPAAAVAEGLVAADLYGHTTHGLALLADYVAEIEAGRMTREGTPEVLSDRGAVACWDARHLPGIWTTALALEAAAAKARDLGLGAVALRRSHHIACLASFLEKPARDGLLALVLCSDPSDAHVAPYGGITPVLTPNPIAAGIPRSPDPVLIDISTSITTAGLCGRLGAEGKRLPGPWLLDARGRPSDDPEDFAQGGTILPLGGLDHGHKGFALSFLIEALTQGLSGFGRADAPTTWGASVLVLAVSPGAFGPPEDFARQVDWLAQACLGATPREAGAPVRLPGQLALARKARAETEGLTLYPGIAAELQGLAERFRLTMPGAR